MDIKINNSWVNDDEEVEEPIIETKNDVIDNKTFNNLMDVPIDPIENFNFDKFMNNIEQPKKSKIKQERKRLFEFREKKINYYYVLPIIGITAYLLIK
jgi:hypothetical protein